MTLLDKFSVAEQLKAGLANIGKDPTSVVFDTINSATEAVVDGRTTILAGWDDSVTLLFNQGFISEELLI